jgi:hypothetical protein
MSEMIWSIVVADGVEVDDMVASSLVPSLADAAAGLFVLDDWT